MKIECILKRHGGTRVELGSMEYHFEPLDDGAHVAEVDDEAHVDRFLSIGEAYKLYRGELSPQGKAQTAADKGVAQQLQAPSAGLLAGSSAHPSHFEVNGKTYSQGEIVRMTFDPSGLTEDEWNALDEEDRAAKIDITLDDLAEAAPEAAGDDREALVAQYIAKFKKAPHPSAKIETIKAKLAE